MADKSAPRGSQPPQSSSPQTEKPVPTEHRLQKFLASAGLGSRRQCEELIRSGRITIDGLPVDNPGMNVDPLKQVVEYDGERLKPERLKYFVLNKPKGVLCTNHDPAGRIRVIDLFAKERVRLFPVGRLDEDSEGLLIVTNDGDLANQLAHPRYRIYRTYRIHVAGAPTNEKLQELKDGIFFREGKFRVIQVRRVGKQGQSTFLEVVLGQGHNREVRRLFARIGHKVLSLERVAFGPIKLDRLKAGQYRELTKKELQELRDMLVRNQQTPGHFDSSASPAGTPKRAPKRDTAPRGELGLSENSIEKKRIPRPASGSLRKPAGAIRGGSGSRRPAGKSEEFSDRPAFGKSRTSKSTGSSSSSSRSTSSRSSSSRTSSTSIGSAKSSSRATSASASARKPSAGPSRKPGGAKPAGAKRPHSGVAKKGPKTYDFS